MTLERLLCYVQRAECGVPNPSPPSGPGISLNAGRCQIIHKRVWYLYI
jgi:hypothetical protein